MCLPEGFAYLGSEPGRADLAEAMGQGPITRALAHWARAHGVWILGGGFPERAPDASRPYNTSVVVSPGGDFVASYRKMHLFDVDLADGTSLRESIGSTPGELPTTCTVGGLCVGLSICYDVRFPELYALERDAGAELLTVPAAFTATTGAAHWHVLLRARAIETQCYLVAPAQVGTHPRGRTTFGHSLIVGPWGEVLAELPEPRPGVVLADVDPARVRAVREQMPVWQHRRLTPRRPC